MATEQPAKPSTALFDVYLRLRPSNATNAERFLDVEASAEGPPTHITIRPPSNDHRKRAVEKFAFTRVFEEDATQLNIFKDVGVLPLIEGVLGAEKREGRDGLLATLGVTGSGKSHTILGTKAQRGITQMALDVLFRSTQGRLVKPSTLTVHTLAQADVSEAQIFAASTFLDSIYCDGLMERAHGSRAQTPMVVGNDFNYSEPTHPTSSVLYPVLYPRISGKVAHEPNSLFFRYIFTSSMQPVKGALSSVTRSTAKIKSPQKDCSSFVGTPSKQRSMPRPSGLPHAPIVEDTVEADPSAEYAIVISMYEVYNDRIYDLLTASMTTAKVGVTKRRALLFKSTELSPDRKVVAGLRKVICSSLEDALSVLETGLIERKVAGTGSNAVSSRSHGFFCVDVKKRDKANHGRWMSSTLTIVDLAGSERARNAKTAGATLAEAGKINESLMYLGQCMQMQSDNQEGNKQNIVPFRQCKLTELLFSNSFPSLHANSYHHSHQAPIHHRSPQKAIMIVTADPLGDFNATSQILRYSALAREVTVPRIPSVTSQILSGAIGSRLASSTGRTSPSVMTEELAQAHQEIVRLQEDIDVLRLQLIEESSRRRAAEASWKAAEEHMLEVEQDVRNQCHEEMEARIEAERRRWKGAWAEEADRNDEHFDRKIDILSRGIQIHEDPAPSETDRVTELEAENETLRRKLELMERELQGRSPTKKQRALKTKKWEAEVGFESP